MVLRASTLSEAGFLMMMSSSSLKCCSPRLIVALTMAFMDWICRFLASTRWRRSPEERISLGTLPGHSDAQLERNEREKINNPPLKRSAFKEPLPFSS